MTGPMTNRVKLIARLTYWPFPNLKTTAAFYGGLLVGVITTGFIFLVGYAVVWCR